MIICGSDDFSYYHTIELVLNNPSSISGVFDWHVDIPDNFSDLIQFEIIFDGIKINFFEDDEVKLKVVCDEISINFDTVYYYERNNLKSDERLSSFIEKNNS